MSDELKWATLLQVFMGSDKDRCEECDKWWLLFCMHKLIVQEVADLQGILDDVLYSCGTTLEDLDMPGQLTNVFVKHHSCADCMKKLYYSCGFESVCVHCASEDVTDSVNLEFLPQCQGCKYLGQLGRPKRKS